MRIRRRSLFPLPPLRPSLPLSKSPCPQPNKEAPPKGGLLEEQPAPSDLQITIVKRLNGWIIADNERNMEPPHTNQTFNGKDEKGEASEKRWSAFHSKSWSAESADESIHLNLFSSSAAAASAFSASSHLEDREVPLKKSRGKGEEKGEEKKAMKEKKKGKMHKRNCDEENDNEEEEEEKKDGILDGGFVKKRGNGNDDDNGKDGVTIEGSRCSRVNGRGWRCCQPTLVGYALCEHHLGKGRLRSMSSVRRRPSAVVTASKERDRNDVESISLSNKQWEGEEDEVEEENLMMMMMKENKKSKKRKIGVLRARSISSLLGQNHHPVSTTAILALGANGHGNSNVVV